MRIQCAGVAVLASWAIGCGGGGEQDLRWEVAVDTVADTVVVRIIAGSVWGDTARLVEEFRIGTMDGGEAYILGDPVGLALGDGRVYVLDSQVPVVRAYDADTGEHLVDLGREGRGPGEYRSPDGVAVLPDGRVLVRDPGTIRINVYAPDGEWLESWPHPNRGGFHTYRPFYVDTAGRSYVTTLLTGGPPWEWELGVISVSPDGSVLDTVPEPPLRYERSYVTASRSDGTSASRRPVPFTGELEWDLTPAGYTVGGITDRYAIYLFPPGEPVLRIERDAAPIPVQPEEASERRERITRGLQRQYGSWRWNGPSVPDIKPPWRSLFADGEGRIWVLRSTRGEEVLTAGEAAAEEQRTGRAPLRYEEPPAYDLFEAGGQFLGPVRVPRGFQIEPRPVVRGDTVWAVERSDLGVPSIVRYRLEIGADR